uniref:Uncharacterized protein n=1 Tax=Anguilla anguilla TaxID=7936 RepID=A0A0E9PZA8_ANGAN
MYCQHATCSFAIRKQAANSEPCPLRPCGCRCKGDCITSLLSKGNIGNIRIRKYFITHEGKLV